MEIKNNEETVECATKSLKEILKTYNMAMPSLINKGIVGDEPKKFTQEEVDQLMENLSSKLWVICKLGLGKELVETSNKIVETENNLGRRLTEEETKKIIDDVVNKMKVKENLDKLSNSKPSMKNANNNQVSILL